MGSAQLVIFSKSKIDQLDHLLGGFYSQANTVWAIFTTLSGQLLAQRGFVYSFDVLTIAAITSSIYISTMELAQLIGERKFSHFLQEGKKFSIYYACIDEDYLLVSLFDDRTLPGVVKVASQDFCATAKKILANEL